MRPFEPDYSNILKVLYNKKPCRLPLYEHHIDIPFISRYYSEEIGLQGNSPEDYRAYHRKIISFWKEMTYDAFDYDIFVFFRMGDDLGYKTSTMLIRRREIQKS